MIGYAARRVMWIIPVLFGISLVTFLLMHLVPGGPWDDDKRLPPQIVANLNDRYGLDEPIWKQYGSFLGNALTGDLGISYTHQDRNVTQIIRQGLPATITLGAIAFLMAVGIGVPLGLLAAVKANPVLDTFTVVFATVFASIPGFVLGIILVIAFSINWTLLPAGGWGTPSHVVLPSLALAVLPMAYIVRITRASVLEVSTEDYVRTAHAKGLRPAIVQYRHILRNALIPVVTVLGPELAALVTGSFIVESIFSVPGIGRLFVQGVLQRDYGLVTGVVLFYAVVITLLNLAVDLLYGLIDPRIREQ